MRYLILLALSVAAWAQPIPSQAFLKGNPPGGVGAACSPTPRVGYLDANGHAIVCPAITNVWTVLAAGGGGATISSTGNAIRGDGGGNGIAVAGSATNIVQVNGSSVAPSTTVNGQSCALGAACTVADATKVPTSQTVNGHALSGPVTVTSSDVGLGTVTNDAQTKNSVVPNTFGPGLRWANNGTVDTVGTATNLNGVIYASPCTGVLSSANATLTMTDTGACTEFTVTTLANVTSIVKTSWQSGKRYKLTVTQGSGGPFTMTGSAITGLPCFNNLAVGTVSTIAGIWDGSNWNIDSTGNNGGYGCIPAGTIPAAAPTSTFGSPYWDGSDGTYKIPNASTTYSANLPTGLLPIMPIAIANPGADNKWCSYIDIHGVCQRTQPTPANVGLGNVTNDAQTKSSIVPNTAPSAGQILVGNAGGTAYAPATISGSCTMTSAAVITCSGSGTAPTFPNNPQSSTYNTVSGDFSAFKQITVASGTFTINLLSTAPTNGQGIWILNYGSGVVTVGRNTLNINGAAGNLTIAAGSASAPNGMFIVSDGTNYFAQPLLGSATGGTGCTTSGATGALQAADGAGGCTPGHIVDASSILTASEPFSLGTNYLSTTQVVGSTGTTANLLCTFDASAQMVVPAIGAVGVLGVCVTTQTSGQNVEVATRGIINCVADNSTTVGHLLGVGTTTAGRCKDLGQTDSTNVPANIQIVGKARTAVSAASSVSLQLYGPGHYGVQVGGTSTQMLYNSSGAAASTPDHTFDGSHTETLGASGIFDTHSGQFVNGFQAPTFSDTDAICANTGGSPACPSGGVNAGTTETAFVQTITLPQNQPSTNRAGEIVFNLGVGSTGAGVTNTFTIKACDSTLYSAGTCSSGGVTLTTSTAVAVGGTGGVFFSGSVRCQIQGGSSSGTIYFQCVSTGSGPGSFNASSLVAKVTSVPMTAHSWVIYATMKFSAATAGNSVTLNTTTASRIN